MSRFERQNNDDLDCNCSVCGCEDTLECEDMECKCCSAECIGEIITSSDEIVQRDT